MWILDKGLKSRAWTCITAISSFTVLAFLLPSAQAQAQAPIFTLLYSFQGSPRDGAIPLGALVLDKGGNLYGSTAFGGTTFGGTVFKLDTTGTETLLYNFTGGADGATPFGLVRDKAGNLYGTTSVGGAFDSGTVFTLDATGTETVLYSFSGAADGANPVAGLVRDKAGNLYGTTYSGGAFGNGTVFKLDTSGKETVLHSFTGTPDGSTPITGLVRDKAGNLYGTTYSGGAFGNGTVFKLDTSGKETVLHSFTGTDGVVPVGSLALDKAGNVYGATTYGGNSICGCGVVFRLDASGKETVLYSFTGGTDGRNPLPV